ncbi:hypothetical protein NPIL_441271 [Nephila pilipes]|uniref:Spider venom protein n=1 Tax=Nephila pilipes TaxID=299642 RepID=A0A8X6TVE0_NEPPI|nr:hypothetical protein NPIL_441271 [Nephila pilipes]
MFRQLLIVCVLLLLVVFQVSKTRSFVPQRLEENVQRLCVNLQSRIRCPNTACSGTLRNCTGHVKCSCSPTSIEVCCSTIGGKGCCLNVPIPLTLGK